MTSQLQVLGAYTGASGGKAQWEVPTLSASKAQPEIRGILLEANVDSKIKVPAEATGFSASFQSASSPAEIKIRTNLNSADAGLPVSSSTGFKFDLFSGTTEVILKSPAPPVVFQILFI